MDVLIDRCDGETERSRRSPDETRATTDNGNGKLALTTLMYVSTSRLDPATATKAVEAIVAEARCRNRVTGVSGALLFTGKHFVQVLEGDDAALDSLMAKLHADSRHENLIVTFRGPLRDRLFADWDLAYSGAAHFVRRRVLPLLDGDDPAEQRRATLALIDIMYQFTKR